MTDYLVTDTELKSIANAIRNKGGTQTNMIFPTGFVDRINNIETSSEIDVNTTGLNNITSFTKTYNVTSGTVSRIDTLTGITVPDDSYLHVVVEDVSGCRKGYFLLSHAVFEPINDRSSTYTTAYSLVYCNSYGDYVSYLGVASLYGIVATSISSDGEINLGARYSSSYSGTINGTYRISVYSSRN